MRQLTADLFISLDGFASGLDQPAFFGYLGDELARWVREQLAEPQIMLMGRVTYQALAPISSSAADESSLRMTGIPKVVFSRTLEDPLVWKNTRVVRGDLASEVTVLKQQLGDPLRSIGSVTLVRHLMQLGLVDRLRLMVFPLVLGDAGREPIYRGYPETPLELISTRVLDARLTLLEYRPAGRKA